MFWTHWWYGAVSRPRGLIFRQMEKIIQYRLKGVDCASCGAKIEAALCNLDGVREVSVTVPAQLLTLTVVPDVATEAKVLSLVSRLGYGAVNMSEAGKPVTGVHTTHTGDESTQKQVAAAHSHAHGFEGNGRWWQQRGARLVLVSAAALVVAWLFGLLFPPLGRWAFTLAMLVGLLPVARRAFAAARAGVPFSIESLMTVAAIGAVVIGAAEEAAMVVLLFLLGELLEGLAAGKARASISKLTDLVPERALVQRGDDFEWVAAAQLQIGDRIRVRPGDRIAADGEIVQGIGSVNEAPVTGESVPREKRVGDRVFAGTVNGESALLVAVSAAAANNTIARVVRLVEEAQQAKAPMARFIDNFARHYTPVIALLALLTACVPPLLGGDWGQWAYKALALLLIGCPCALVISTPAAVAAGLAQGARRGLLMKGGVVLEAVGRLGVIAFDKTGTLTSGTPEVTDVWDAPSASSAGVANVDSKTLELAAALEAGSSHPLALAVLSHARERGVQITVAEHLSALVGRGVAGVIAGRRYFLGSANAAAYFTAFDAPSRARIKALAEQGKTVCVLLAEPLGETAKLIEPLDGSANTFAKMVDQHDADWQVVGVLALRDQLRADAVEGIAKLRMRGVRCLMLTGDTEPTANAIAAELGIMAQAELLPQDKQRIVTELKQQAEGGRGLVGVVGDGINDAPALAAADVGIAMGGGTDVALETADAAILRGNVSDVAAMVDLSRATLRNIYQNITFALGFKAVFFVTTLIGITGLWPAILADTGATVIVTLNAMRLLRWRYKG